MWAWEATLSSSRSSKRWTNVRPGKSQTCWSSLWNPCCRAQVREASAPYWSRCGSSVGRTWAPMRSPSPLWHDQRCEGLGTFQKKRHIFLKERYSNQLDGDTWSLMTAHRMVKMPGLRFCFSISFFSENIMGIEKHRESLWTLHKNSAGSISKNISLITYKFGDQDYTPSEDILLARRPSKIFISTTLKLNMFFSKCLIQMVNDQKETLIWILLSRGWHQRFHVSSTQFGLNVYERQIGQSPYRNSEHFLKLSSITKILAVSMIFFLNKINLLEEKV